MLYLNKTFYHTLIIGLIISLISCAEQSIGIPNTVTLDAGNYNEQREVYYAEEFTDFQLVRLENKNEAMLSWITKVVATDKGLYILDNKTPARLYHFEFDGSYIHQIGEYGRKKTEYTDIVNFSTTPKGDTIALYDFRRVVLYSDKGTFIESIPITEVADEVQIMSHGLLASDYHHVGKHLFSLYKDGERKKGTIENQSGVIKGTAYSLNNFQQNEDYICYYDFFASRFYLISKNNIHNIRCFQLQSEDFLDEQKSLQPKKQRSQYSYVTNYTLCDSVIVGLIKRNTQNYNFKINLNTPSIEYIDFKVGNYYFDAYKDGVFYKLLSPTTIMTIMRQSSNSQMKELLKEAFAPYKDSISEKDNYFILSMRKK